MTNMTTDAAEARARLDKLETRDVHTGYDEGGNFVYEDYVRLADVRELLATAEAASGAGEREGKHVCPHCRFSDISYERTCHNSNCSAYALPETIYEGWKPSALASLPPATDPAMVTVPSEPTEAMIAAWFDAPRPPEVDFRPAYRAMLAAAPTIPATGEAVPDRFTNDTAAKALYDTWSDMPGWVPWVERGNSDMQERARREVMLCQRIEWEGTEAQQQHERMKACRERCAQMGDDDCDGDGSCEECEMDMAEALETPASRKRRALATIPATGHAATEGEGA